MTNEAKRTMVDNFLASLSAQDGGALNALVTDDFEWNIVPPSLDTEPVRGRGAVDAIVTVLGDMYAVGALNFETTRSAVDGDNVVLETHVTADTLSGKRYDNWYVHWFEFNDGLIATWREHLDTKQALDLIAD